MGETSGLGNLDAFAKRLAEAATTGEVPVVKEEGSEVEFVPSDDRSARSSVERTEAYIDGVLSDAEKALKGVSDAEGLGDLDLDRLKLLDQQTDRLNDVARGMLESRNQRIDEMKGTLRGRIQLLVRGRKTSDTTARLEASVKGVEKHVQAIHGEVERLSELARARGLPETVKELTSATTEFVESFRGTMTDRAIAVFGEKSLAVSDVGSRMKNLGNAINLYRDLRRALEQPKLKRNLNDVANFLPVVMEKVGSSSDEEPELAKQLRQVEQELMPVLQEVGGQLPALETMVNVVGNSVFVRAHGDPESKATGAALEEPTMIDRAEKEADKLDLQVGLIKKLAERPGLTETQVLQAAYLINTATRQWDRMRGSVKDPADLKKQIADFEGKIETANADLKEAQRLSSIKGSRVRSFFYRLGSPTRQERLEADLSKAVQDAGNAIHKAKQGMAERTKDLQVAEEAVARVNKSAGEAAGAIHDLRLKDARLADGAELNIKLNIPQSPLFDGIHIGTVKDLMDLSQAWEGLHSGVQSLAKQFRGSKGMSVERSATEKQAELDAKVAQWNKDMQAAQSSQVQFEIDSEQVDRDAKEVRKSTPDRSDADLFAEAPEGGWGPLGALGVIKFTLDRFRKE